MTHPLHVERLARWLLCPNCGNQLMAQGVGVVGCAVGHRFDLNKRGYVSLLSYESRGITGDTASMLSARQTVLQSGIYAPIATAIAELLGDLKHQNEEVRVLDAGCGTGYYLSQTLDHVAADRKQTSVVGLAMDVSPAAVSMATRGDERVDGLVADTWRPIPVRDLSADAILNVFAPRNLPEFARILAPHGKLIVVVPRETHLSELRTSRTMLNTPDGKAEHLIDSARETFALTAQIEVTFSVTVDEAVASRIVEMGPTGHHRKTTASAHGSAETSGTADAVTVAVDVLAFELAIDSPRRI